MVESEIGEDLEIGPLLGYNPNLRNVLEATQMTEIYEFARSLANPDFSVGLSFVESKFNYTKELINFGFVQEAYSYCEEMTKSLRRQKIHGKEQELAKNILGVAERLVNCASGEQLWIQDLRKMADQLDSESTSRKLSLATSTSDHIDDSSIHNVHINHIPSYTDNSNSQHDGAPESENNNSAPATTNFRLNGNNVNSNQWDQPPPIQPYPSVSSYDPTNNLLPEISNLHLQQPAPNFQLGNGPLHNIPGSNII